jgi:hypothetical protein
MEARTKAGQVVADLEAESRSTVIALSARQITNRSQPGRSVNVTRLAD